jgi:hypothetical protein
LSADVRLDASSWAHALTRALTELWKSRDRSDFYYVVLATTDALDFPAASAWSHTALGEKARLLGVHPDEIRFSYADSPFLHFDQPYTSFLRPEWDAAVRAGRTGGELIEEAHAALRLRVLVDALALLRLRGVLDANVLVNVELGDVGDIARARSLNAPSVLLTQYLGPEV